MEDWLCALHQGYEVRVVYFEISKAFDTIPHLALLHILEELRLSEGTMYLLRWIGNYLLGRKQFVILDGTKLSYISSGI